MHSLGETDMFIRRIVIPVLTCFQIHVPKFNRNHCFDVKYFLWRSKVTCNNFYIMKLLDNHTRITL